MVILATMRSEEYARFSERAESHLPSLGRETVRQGWDVLSLATRIDGAVRQWCPGSSPRTWSSDVVVNGIAGGQHEDWRLAALLAQASTDLEQSRSVSRTSSTTTSYSVVDALARQSEPRPATSHTLLDEAAAQEGGHPGLLLDDQQTYRWRLDLTPASPPSHRST